jgi:hypothetical protein
LPLEVYQGRDVKLVIDLSEVVVSSTFKYFHQTPVLWLVFSFFFFFVVVLGIELKASH